MVASLRKRGVAARHTDTHNVISAWYASLLPSDYYMAKRCAIHAHNQPIGTHHESGMVPCTSQCEMFSTLRLVYTGSGKDDKLPLAPREGWPEMWSCCNVELAE